MRRRPSEPLYPRTDRHDLLVVGAKLHDDLIRFLLNVQLILLNVFEDRNVQVCWLRQSLQLGNHGLLLQLDPEILRVRRSAPLHLVVGVVRVESHVSGH